ncbi:MAG: cysteine--tRNA ligase, partial [Deltaproteobacteria bacterium]|nr:cysteine--tRNA ligase [Deltaproteobacteria bacterium]
EKGAAYESDHDVYFSVPDFPPYGSLSGRNLDDLRAGARVEVGKAKRNPLDFALWKASKPGEPAWESPWGPGRPGWHIECSVMAAKYLGQPFDIHGGGQDLIFPHHENEKAQAEALTGRPFVRYWVHNGFVRAGAEKMSKSLGNFLTIQEIIKRFHPQALRLFLLSAHYRSPLDYTEEAMAEADEGINRLYEAWSSAMMGYVQHKPSDKGPLKEAAEEARQAFKAAMDNDFNTAQALGHLFFLARSINRSLDKEEGLGGLAVASETLEELSNVLGLLTRPYGDFRDERQNLLLDRDDLEAVSIQSLIDARTESRQSKDFAVADRIREELAQMGVELHDGPEGQTTWKLKA